MTKSALQIARAAYQPKLPKALTGAVVAKEGEPTQSVADQEDIKKLFPNTYGMPLIQFVEGEAKEFAPMNVGVILSGGQAPGGHNVISGLFDGIKKLNPANKLYGFILGPGGLVDHNYMELTADIIDEYRNTGGFDIIGSGRTKLEKEEQFEKGYEILKELGIKALVIIGGDGASYDIGYGGLDHVIASGEDVNILVLDTEVYSNTGGQSSKATPLGAIAKFAASGKRVRKKDLGMIATTYGYVYVAQIAMGADQAQTLKAIREAEAYPGPSLVIAYAPCINHGLKAGMGKSQAEEAKAVECGYWHLWRFNPALEEEGKNPFSLDSKEPNWEGFQDYLKGEVRFASVMKQYPTEAADLFAACEDMAKKRYASYKRMAAMDWSDEKAE